MSICVCSCLHVHSSMCTCLYVLHIFMFVYMCKYMCMWEYACMCVFILHVYAFMCKYVCVHVCIGCKSVYMHMHMCVCMCVSVYIYVFVCAYIFRSIHSSERPVNVIDKNTVPRTPHQHCSAQVLRKHGTYHNVHTIVRLSLHDPSFDPKWCAELLVSFATAFLRVTRT